MAARTSVGSTHPHGAKASKVSSVLWFISPAVISTDQEASAATRRATRGSARGSLRANECVELLPKEERETKNPPRFRSRVDHRHA
jgi:hypothetical protein